MLPFSQQPRPTLVVGALLAGSLLPATPHWGAQPRPARNRIQLRQYHDSAGNRDYSLTQVVRIHRGAIWATGSLLQNCRVLTALHPLIKMKSAGRREKLLDENESLVGDAFEFETIPLRALQNRRATGHFVVIAHGQLDRPNLEELLDEKYPADWAIGYDNDCIADSLTLGVVRLPQGFFSEIFDYTEEWNRYFTAGYSAIPDVPGTGSPNFTQYIDARCGLSHNGNEEALALMRFSNHQAELKSDCSVSRGGAGQPLLSMPDGSGRLIAWGMFERMLPQLATEIPHVKRAWAVQPFNGHLLDLMKPFLEGPVDRNLLDPPRVRRY